MIQLGSKVRVVRSGEFEFRGEVVDMVGRIGRCNMVRVRPDSDQVTVVAYPGQHDRWVELVECVEEPVMPAPPDAPFPRPTLADAVALRILSDWLEEQGNDPGAALLRDVAGRIEQDVQLREGLAEFGRAYREFRRAMFPDLQADVIRLREQGRDASGLYAP